jgi:hypothetical protein
MLRTLMVLSFYWCGRATLRGGPTGQQLRAGFKSPRVRLQPLSGRSEVPNDAKCGREEGEAEGEALMRTGEPEKVAETSGDAVSDYRARYVTKEGAWWNVKLLSHRHPQFETQYVLSSGTP